MLISGLTKEVFKEVELLQKNNILLPPILEFTYLARKKKKVKIDYHTDIRDIIKDCCYRLNYQKRFIIEE